MKVETLDRLIRDSGVTVQENVRRFEVADIKIEMIRDKCNELEKRMNSLEDNFNAPVERLADTIRDNVVVPLLRRTLKPEGISLSKDDKLLVIGSIVV